MREIFVHIPHGFWRLLISALSRRKFMAATAGAAAYLGTVTAKADSAPPRPPQVPLGKTGITMSRVGQGTGMRGGTGNRITHAWDSKSWLPSSDTAMIAASRSLIWRISTVDVYFREALRYIPRDKISILTKIWWRYDGPATPQAEPWAAAFVMRRSSGFAMRSVQIISISFCCTA